MAELVQVYTANSRFDAEALVLLLSSFHIPAMINQESAGAAYGLTGVPLGVVQILVPINFEKEAVDILNAMERGELEAPKGTINQDELDNPDFIEPL